MATEAVHGPEQTIELGAHQLGKDVDGLEVFIMACRFW